MEGSHFMHAIGGQFNMGLNRDVAPKYFTGGITYHPRVNLGGTKNMFNVSLDMPLTLTLGTGTDFLFYPNPLIQPKSKFGVTLEVPVQIGLNFGHGAGRETAASFGGFFGAGYSFAYIPLGVAVKDALPIGHGPRGQLGIRFKTGVVSWQLSGNFMFNLYQRSHIAGVGVALTLGSWKYY